MSGIVSPKLSGIAFALTVILILGSVPVLAAQRTDQAAPTASLADRLIAAHSVFVSNTNVKNVANATRDSDQAASGFYSAMQGWNRYHLASTAADADLVFQIAQEQTQVRLTILDPNTQVVLGILIQHVDSGFLPSTRDKNLNQAIGALVDALRRLSGQPAAPPPPSVARAGQRTSGKRPKLFISNVGSDDDVTRNKGMAFTAGPDQPYNKFYAALQSSAQYELVSSPAGADFVFAIRYTVAEEKVTKWVDKPFSDTTPREQEKVEYTVYYPKLQLVILDPKTLAVLGASTEFITVASRQSERSAKLTAAINALANDAGMQLGHPLATTVIPNVISPPVPPQLTAARTVFISNVAGKGIIGGTPSTGQAYNEFYAMMKSWGGYQLSSTPAGADLIFTMSYANSQVHLAMLDPQTKITLWGFTPDVRVAIRKSNAQKNFDQTLLTLIENIARVTGKPEPAISVPQDIKDAPIPLQISTAKTAFIANAGGESIPGGTGKTEQAYNEFYATIKTWGRYELVPSATEADLVFQISYAGSQLQLAILDARTQVVLWELNQKVPDSLTSLRESKFKEAIASLVKSTAILAGQPAGEISVPAGINTTPVPPGISDSRKVFLSRPTSSGARAGISGDKETLDQLYNQIYADMKGWGRYELTATPGEADLIFEPSAFDYFTGGVKLTVRDAKAHIVLWTFTQPVKIAFLNSTADRNFNAAIGLLMNDVRRAASLSAQPSKVALRDSDSTSKHR
jgi:hypothetical protein